MTDWYPDLPPVDYERYRDLMASPEFRARTKARMAEYDRAMGFDPNDTSEFGLLTRGARELYQQGIEADLHRRSDGPCWYCGNPRRRMIEEHCTPVSRGGTNQPTNLVTACASCNTIKGARTLEEFRAELQRRIGKRVVFFGETPAGADLAPYVDPDPLPPKPNDPFEGNAVTRLGL